MTISVVRPIYNVSAYIERCILSVMSQTYNDFDSILVDDASPDDSICKCEQMNMMDLFDFESCVIRKIVVCQRQGIQELMLLLERMKNKALGNAL